MRLIVDTNPSYCLLEKTFVLQTVALASHNIDVRGWLPCSFWLNLKGDKPDSKKKSSKSFCAGKRKSLENHDILGDVLEVFKLK